MTNLTAPTQLNFATSEGYVIRATGVSGNTATYQKISPSPAQLLTIGTVIKLIADPRNPKQLILLGTNGIAYTPDATALSVIWQVVNPIGTISFDAYASANIPGNDTGIVINIGDIVSISASGTWIWDHPADDFTGPDGTYHLFVNGNIVLMDEIEPSFNGMALLARVGTSGSWTLIGSRATFTANTTGNLYLIANDRMNYFTDNLGALHTLISVNGINISDIQGSVNQRNYFGWLSKRNIAGTDYVYYNYTSDFFNTVSSTKVARYSINMVYSISLAPLSNRPGNVNKVWVTAGVPGTDAAIYESSDLGASFRPLSIPSIGASGGVTVMPRTLANGLSGMTSQNLIALQKADDQHDLSTSGLNNQVATVSNVGGPLNSQALNSFLHDGKYLNAAVYVNTIWKLLTSDDGGVNWNPSTLTSGWEVQALAGWSSSKDYLLIGGTNTLAYTPDRGANWNNLWMGTNGFSNWASINLGNWSNKIISALVSGPPAMSHDGPGVYPFSHYCNIADTPSSNPVKLQNGDKFEEMTDLTLNTPAGPLVFTRTFRQSKETDGNYQFMGMGWTHNHLFKLTKIVGTPNRIIARLLGASEAHFTETTTNHYEGDPGSASYIDYNTTTTQFTWVAPDTSTYIFDINGKLITRIWPGQAETWTYSYAGTKLSRVDDGYGRQLNFSYISNPGQYNDGQLWRVGDQNATGLGTGSPAGIYVEFGYTPQKNNGVTVGSPKALLASVRDVRSNLWTYDYYGQHASETISNQLDFLTKRQSPAVDMDGDGSVESTLTLENLDYTFSGASLSAITQKRGIKNSGQELLKTDFAFGQNATNETIAQKTTIHQFANGLYVGHQDPAGNSTSQNPNYQYRPEAQQDANGNTTLLQWSPDGKQLQQAVDAQGNKTAFAYNTSSGKSNGTLQSSVDAQGYQTVYSYMPLDQGPALHKPTDIRVRTPNGAITLRWQTFTYDTHERLLTEQTLDPNGGQPLQQTTRAYYASGNGNGLLQTLTKNDSINPANNVVTTYFYDTSGRVIKTNQNTTFGSCSSSFTLYDAAGNVIASICNYDPGVGADPTNLSQVLALYDATKPDKNRITTYVYDTLGRRVQTTTDAQAAYARTTLTVYDALDRVIRTITNYVAVPGISDPYAHLRADFTHGSNNDQNLIADTTYNLRGFVRSQTDVLGNVTLFGYDDADRLVKTVQSASQPAYNNEYGTGDPSLSLYLPSSTVDQDLITTSLYDAAGNLVKTTDVTGNATFTVYDSLNRPIKTVRSASQPAYNILTDPSLANYLVSTTTDKDLVDTTDYDTMGRVKRTQDALGNFTLFGYDGLGQQVKTIRFASKPTYDLVADPSLTNYRYSMNPDQDLITQTAYDAAGRVMYTTDSLGRNTWTGYDGLGRVIRTVRNAVGTATDGGVRDPRSATYNPVVSQSDVDQITLTTYDSNGYVLWTQDPLGRKTWFAYDSIGRQIKTIVNAVGTATDGGPRDPRSAGYILSTNADQDLVTQTIYDAKGRVAATLDSAGNRTQFAYDALDRRAKTITNFVTGIYNATRPDQDLISTTIYDLAGRVALTTDARGTQTAFSYDRVGRQVIVTQAVGTSLATMSYTCYDKGGRVLRTLRNWTNDKTQPSPDARDVNGSFLYNPLTHGTNNDQNLVTRYTLNQLGQQVAMIDPLGNTSQIAYDKDGQIESLTDPLSFITKYRYDSARRRKTVVQAWLDNGQDPVLWKWNGTLWTKSDGTTAIGFGTSKDRNIIVQADYDKAGRTTALRDPRGNRTTYIYDLLDRRTGLTDPLGNLWTTAYAVPNIGVVRTTLTNPTPLSTVSQQETDQLGRVASLKYLNESPKNTPDVTFSYHRLGRSMVMNEWNAATLVRSTALTYDQARRLVKADFDSDGNGTVDQTVSYVYDAGGLRTQLTLPGNLSVTYQYDAKGRLTSLTDWSAQATQYAYDGADRLNTVQRYAGINSTYGYDAASRLTSLRTATNSNAKTRGQFLYTVDARGNRTQVYEAVARAASGQVILGYYDPSVNYTQGTWTTSDPFKFSTNTNAIFHVAFMFDTLTLNMGVGPDHGKYDIYIDGTFNQNVDGYAAAAGPQAIAITLTGDGPHTLEVRNTTQKNAASTGNTVRFQNMTSSVSARLYDLQTLQYSYDALSRLMTANSFAGDNVAGGASRQYSYGYDVAGNRLQQIVTIGSTPTTTTYTYDNANRIINDGTHTFSYDNAGRMTSDGVNTYAWDRANRLLSEGVSAYLYDGLGRRVQQTVGANVTKYVLDVQPGLAQVLAATTGANTTRYLHSPTGIAQQQNPDNSWRWMVQDGLGSVRGVLDAGPTPQMSQLYSP
ncbi:MAG: DUF6531 domain-containing protein, partial [Chloroflexota bacterium]